MTAALDRRLNAWRDDLADERLRGQVEADRFVSGGPGSVIVPVANVHRQPASDSGVDTQFLLGDSVRIFESCDGWSWIQGQRDNYVGYVSDADLAPGEVEPPTHRVIALSTFVYPAPELKLPPLQALSMGSLVTVASEEERRGNRYAILPDGTAIFARHLAPAGEHASDFVTVAECFMNIPYLWGGTSGFGVDCSGLIQLPMAMAGRTVLRDSYMQEATIGESLDPGPDYTGLRRGDLVFWTGHVGIMTDGKNMLHANGLTMTVAREPLSEAIARIEPVFGKPTSLRRP
jgi:cell wall-associated NlpC family hydrolase